MIYSASGTMHLTDEEKDKIVRDYMPQIKAWAQRAKNGLPDAVDIDELYSAAAFGLIECLDKYDKTRNASFATYVEHRVKGAILDALRGLDFLSRNARFKLKSLEQATQELSVKIGRTPTLEEIADYTEMPIEKVCDISSLQYSHKTVSLDESVDDESGLSLVELIQSNLDTPEEDLMRSRLVEQLAAEINKLAEKERMVITLYYYEELTMKEIAQTLDITESRVSQLHSTALSKMKKRLKDV
jgi:RNA polymerase sigma factor for flagellar operon FliA